MPTRKTLLIAWYMDIHWRNIHGSGLLAHLEKDFDRVIVLGPKVMPKEPGMKFESITDRWLGTDPVLNWAAEVHKLRTILKNTEHPDEVVKGFMAHLPWHYFFSQWAYPIVRSIFFAFLTFRLICALPKLYRIKPSVILTSSFVWGSFDSVLGLYSKLLRVPWFAMVTGWDNPSTKGKFVMKPTKVIVWGEKNRKDCKRFQNLSPDNVIALPPPHFARLREAAHSPDPAEKVITYIGVTGINYRHELEFINLLIRTWREMSLREKFKLCLRPHPNDAQSWVNKFTGDDRLYIDPSTVNRSSAWTVFSSDRAGLDSYFRLLRQSVVVINHYSTAMVEAGLLKVPSIIPRIAFPEGAHLETRLDYFSYTMELRRSPGIVTISNENELKAALAITTKGMESEAIESHFLACEKISKLPSNDLFESYSKALSSQL
jgi:hypothetical protein